MRALLILLILILFSCSLTDSSKEKSSTFTFAQESDAFKIRTPYIFIEPFYNYDPVSFVGERTCSLLTNGVVDSVFKEPISMELETIIPDTTVIDPVSGNLQQVTVVEETFYRKGAFQAKTTLYMQSRIDGFYLLYYVDNDGELHIIPEEQQYHFPTEPISGYVTDASGGQDTTVIRNNWRGTLCSPVLHQYPHDLSGAYTMIESAFALEALTQPAYVINGTGFPDGIDVKTYHQSLRDYSKDGVPCRTTSRIVESNYYFKFWGIREKQYAVVEETQVGKGVVKTTRDHYLLQWIPNEDD